MYHGNMLMYFFSYWTLFLLPTGKRENLSQRPQKRRWSWWTKYSKQSKKNSNSWGRFCRTVLGAILVVGPGHPKLLEILPAEATNSISTSRQGSLVGEAPVGISVRKTYIPFTLPKIGSKKHGHEPWDMLCFQDCFGGRRILKLDS